jgi:transcriptional regulator with XRE-family HTH domain
MIAEQLKELRKAYNISPRVLGESVGATRSTIINMERTNNGTTKILRKIAKKYNVVFTIQ